MPGYTNKFPVHMRIVTAYLNKFFENSDSVFKQVL